MVSITSVISFFILLLATYSYSAPIEHEYETSTTKYEFTSGKTTVDQGDKVKKNIISDDESTHTPTIHEKRLSEKSNSEEATTHDVIHPSSTIEDSSFSSSTEINKKNVLSKIFHFQHQLK